MIFEQAMAALTVIFDPMRFLIIMLGCVLGLFIGVIPGIGGLAGMALLLPFTYTMDAYTALAFLIGMWAVTPTADTIPSILIGVPGAAGSAATVMDGYPMARRGEAGRALGASYTASLIGGIFGALLLAVSIPILRPFMMAFGTPELLALCILGLTLVAAVSQGNMMKGLVAACFGVVIASVGDEAQTGELRWTFDSIYLWEGVPLEALVLGLFAVPELIELGAARQAVAMHKSESIVRDQFRGVKDAIQNIRLVLQSSWLGAILGSVPGLGGPAIDWIAYGSAAKSVKGGTETFGTGDVRGVIACEAANNSREGGALIPTLAFGIPASATMAILLGAFMMHGIQPGPKLLTEQLDITYTIVWSLMIANIIGVLICFAFVSQLAKLAMVPAGILVPTVLAIVFIGAYSATRDIGDIIVLLIFSVIGWGMKRFGWARAPVLLGLVLGGLVEQYLFISTSRYGATWLQRPGVIFILLIPVVYFAYTAVRFFLKRRNAEPALAAVGAAVSEPVAPKDIEPAGPISAVDRIMLPGMWILAALLFITALATSTEWALAARLMPQTVSAVGLIVVICSGIGVYMRKRAGETIVKPRKAHMADVLEAMPDRELYPRMGIMFAWVLGVFVGSELIGLLPTLFIYMVAYMRFEGKQPWLRTLVIAICIWASMFILFDKLLNMPWPQSYLGDAFPALRTMVSDII
ncbi:tripartite tricarboxylate transporter permease [Rhizobium sp. XQZ8]|uniref:tripartite tricarboxylate transporter permease n=1 Tax=Rhizobium populisoli TaxID=2859785 RepID=UPI001C6860F1|nr:tripartite tricarboxylate transporter permease [Rhizobium populisoli]MBW6422278.1 tripartite tricarboxylate transporter permease [Rhizobium populisoli]